MRPHIAVRDDVRAQRRIGRIDARTVRTRELLARMVFLVARQIQRRLEAVGRNEWIAIRWVSGGSIGCRRRICVDMIDIRLSVDRTHKLFTLDVSQTKYVVFHSYLMKGVC